MNIAPRHSTSVIWMTPRSRGTLYRRICMFNVVSVACAPRPRSFSHRRDIKYTASPFADVSTSSKGVRFYRSRWQGPCHWQILCQSLGWEGGGNNSQVRCDQKVANVIIVILIIKFNRYKYNQNIANMFHWSVPNLLWFNFHTSATLPLGQFLSNVRSSPNQKKRPHPRIRGSNIVHNSVSN